MKLKKKIKFSDSNQVWRIKISDTDKLFIETRDTQNMKAYYHCFEIPSGKKIFSKHQMDEIFWLGIEAIQNDIVYFHRFAKPDMPGHKGIFAFDINTQNILWEDERFSFLFLKDNLIYVYQEGFEGRYFYTLAEDTGKVVKELGQIPSEINKLREEAESEIDYSDYVFPEKFFASSGNSKVDGIINAEITNIEISGNAEFAIAEDLLVFNYHEIVEKDLLSNKINAVDLKTGKEIYAEVLNKSANAFAPDSFFIYKNMVILIREKKEVFVFEIKA
jgi:hypothetical protein